MLRVVLKTAPSFGRSLANSSKTSDEVKSQTFLQVESMLNNIMTCAWLSVS